MAWKLVLPLLSTLLALANAGGRTLSAQESTQFLDLYRRYCSSPSSTPSQDGNTMYYCKTADNGPITLNLNHETETRSDDMPKQVVFVQPPSYQYIHNVALRGSPGNPQQTDIYVLPSTAEHNVQFQDQRTAQQAVKPSLYFLNDQQGAGSGSGGGGSYAGLPPNVARGGGGGGPAGGFRSGARPTNPTLPRPSSTSGRAGGYS